MEYLYSPWRDKYINRKSKGCVFCKISDSIELDNENRVLYRDRDIFVVMNRYPYTPGHFMVIPHLHIDNIEDLDKEIWLKISIVTQKGVALLKKFGALGVNIGMNLGDIAGAGIESHIHMHLVPRYPRDTNFITTISNTRVYSTDFNEVFEKLKELSKEFF